MIFNIFNIVLLIILTTVQGLMPIADSGRTYFSYIIPWISVVFRSLFVLKTFGIPVSVRVTIFGDILVYLFSMFFFLSAYYKKGFSIYLSGIVINIICIAVVLATEIIEDNLFIYEYREEKSSND